MGKVSTVKRKHVTLSLQKKYEILQELRKGTTASQLAKIYKLGSSTISDIKKNQAKIEGFIKNGFTCAGERKTLKNAHFPKMEQALYDWFVEQRSQQMHVSQDNLAEKAKEFYQKFYTKTDFTASKGWILKFKSRYGIKSLKMNYKTVTTDTETIENFKENLLQKIQLENLLPSQIYNADQSVLCYKSLPSKVLVGSNEESESDKLTFLTCANGDGSHKLKLLITGRATNIPSFEDQKLPFTYKSTKSTCMTSSLVQDWFQSSFVPEVKIYLQENNLPEKALLLINNVPCYNIERQLVSDDGLITTMYLPPNCEAFNHPIDSTIQLTKLLYRKNLLSHFLSTYKSDITNRANEIDLQHAACLLSESWQMLPSDLLVKQWDSIVCEETWEAEMLIPKSILHQTLEFIDNHTSDIRELLSQLNPEHILTSHEIKTWLEEESDVALNEDTKEMEDEIDCANQEELANLEEQPRISNDVALKSLDTSIQWAEENEVSDVEVGILKKLREKAMHLVAVKSFDTCLHWAEENNISNTEIHILQNLKDKALQLSQEQK